jgi:NADPH2:quinone reductase
MKAIRVHQTGDPSVMRLEELPDPEPGPGQVLVRVAAAGVNPVDTYVRAGGYARMPSLPYTPGWDAAGVVVSAGAGARVTPGDRVFLSGTAGEYLTGAYADLAVCHASQVHPLPGHVTFAQGAAIGIPYATAYRAIFQKAHALPGETVLVHGASGGVGIAAVQLARAAGMTVIATAGTDRGRELVRAEGAHDVLDHSADGYLEELPRLSGGNGPDVILEMLANVNLNRDLGVVAPHGRVVVIGSRGALEVNPRLAMLRDVTVLGLALWNATGAEMASIHAALLAGLESRTLRPVVGCEVPLAEAPRAHDLVMRPGHYGKVVLVP